MPRAKRCGVTTRSATRDSRHLLAERAQDLVDPCRRPDVRDHQDLRGAIRLRGEPRDRRRLLIGQPRPGVALAEDRAVVLARAADRAAVGPIGSAERLAREVLRAADVFDVVLERPSFREPLGCDHDDPPCAPAGISPASPGTTLTFGRRRSASGASLTLVDRPPPPTMMNEGVITRSST